MSYTLRPFEDADYSCYAELLNSLEPEKMSEEHMRERDKAVGPNGFLYRTVACLDGSRPVGFSSCAWYDYEKPGTFFVNAVVAPEHRRQGVGAQLCEAALGHAESKHAQALFSYVREDRPEGVAFAERRGFSITEHIFESSLDPQLVPLDDYRSLLEKLAEQGITFHVYSDLGDSPENRRNLWQLETGLERDIPTENAEFTMDFESWEANVIHSAWFRPDAQIIAMHEGKWIGLAMISAIKATVLHNELTGVVPEYRGRGIALALKVKTVEYALRKGQKLKTNNHSTNSAMLAVNRKLGYKPEPGWILLKKVLR